jgi:beta-glucosidase/6-phospho-beta-glucosidase/beta-galactosidase
MTTASTFPDAFRWDVATAAHQVEGGNVNSDTWLLERQFRVDLRLPAEVRSDCGRPGHSAADAQTERGVAR